MSRNHVHHHFSLPDDISSPNHELHISLSIHEAIDTTDHADATQDTPYTATTANPAAKLDIQHVHGPLYKIKKPQGLHFVEPGADGINRKAARG